MYCNSRYCGLFLTHHSRRRTSHRIHMKLLTLSWLTNSWYLESRQIKSCEAVEERRLWMALGLCSERSSPWDCGGAGVRDRAVEEGTQYSMCRTPARSVA